MKTIIVVHSNTGLFLSLEKKNQICRSTNFSRCQSHGLVFCSCAWESAFDNKLHSVPFLLISVSSQLYFQLVASSAEGGWLYRQKSLYSKQTTIIHCTLSLWVKCKHIYATQKKVQNTSVSCYAYYLGKDGREPTVSYLQLSIHLHVT